MTCPLISVVIPVYNGEALLEQTLASVARAVERVPRHERDLVEVIACDNWSTDATPSVLRDFKVDCAFEVVRPPAHEQNRTRNWHYGLTRARGDWVMMLHGDDLLADVGLLTYLRAARSADAEHASLIVGRHRTFTLPDAPGPVRPRWPRRSLVDGPRVARSVLALQCPFTPFSLMRADAYSEVGGLDESWELLQDWELWIRLAQAGMILYEPHEVGWWRIHDTSPRYQQLNGREHARFVSNVVSGIPGISGRTAWLAARVQAARAFIQLSSGKAEAETEILAITPEAPVPGNVRSAIHMSRLGALTASARLNVLRAWGSWFLARRPA